ncbi:MAG: protein-L-isoaspartate(D-aspartate) O-methyltransferase [Nitrospiraceae bacterium]|nr:MAG: protein-L-isoaspartate(D-aspartate) O-methyltransferase [Nitrospiraceae bacterium]
MDFIKQRRLMVDLQLRPRGIKDEGVLHAMATVERHLFVSEDLQESAYDDCALPIGCGQTISQPYMVALMTELLHLEGHERVLEIGTGSGYQTAVLSMLASEVYTVERIPSLAERAQALLERLGYKNVQVRISDGTIGLPSQSPFDAILVTAGAPEIPEEYIGQLKVGGRLVIPIGSRYSQVLYQIRRTETGIEKSDSTGCVFVPLIGEKGWKEEGLY